MTPADRVYLAFIAVGLLVDHFVLWPAFLRRSKVDSGRARVWLWSGYLALFWALVAVGVALWWSKGRSWESLRMTHPRGWRMWVGIALVLGSAYVMARPAITIARSRRPVRVKMGHAHVQRILPRTGGELGWWMVASLTAGICEEFVFRGYLIWAFQPWLGLWGAAALSVVAFGLGHAYQGARGILGTALLGAAFTLVVLGLGSLFPAMALHALADAGQGLIAWLAVRRAGIEEARQAAVEKG